MRGEAVLGERIVRFICTGEAVEFQRLVSVLSMTCLFVLWSVQPHLTTHKVVDGRARSRAIRHQPRNASVLYLVGLGRPNGSLAVEAAATP